MQFNSIIWSGNNLFNVGLASPKTLINIHPLWTNELIPLSQWQEYKKLQTNDGLNLRAWCKKATSHIKSKIIVCGQCNSTMMVCRSFLEKDVLSTWDCILSVSQNKGHGQYGRNWHSPPGNIYASFVFPSSFAISNKSEQLSWSKITSLLVGYAISRAFENIKIPVKLKWPNDLILNGYKVGGILVEEKNDVPIIGIGINLDSAPLQKELFRKNYVMPATALNLVGFNFTPLTFWEKIYSDSIKIIKKTVELYSVSKLLEVLSQTMLWGGEEVMVILPCEVPFKAQIKGIANDGGLILQSKTGKRVIYSGSVFSPT